jgi:hypothetical protein
MPHLDAITIHARRPAALGEFWSELLGLPIDPSDVAAIANGTLAPDESVLLGRRDGLHVWISPAVELAPIGGRIHLDVRLAPGRDATWLAGLGAIHQWDDPQGRWAVYTDPEGNRFCAVASAAPHDAGP